MKMSKVHTILVITMLLLGGVVFSSAASPVSAQTTPSTDTPTPNPTVMALENRVATQEAKIDSLEREQIFEARERDIGFRDINSKWQSWLTFFGIAGGILALVGIKSARDLWNAIQKAEQDWKNNVEKLEKEWEKRSEVALDSAVYKLDMANIPIFLPADENVGSVHRLLQQRKFDNIRYYKEYNEFESGVLVVSLKGKDEEAQKETLGKFKEYIETQKPSAIATGFIVYSPDGIKVPANVQNCHDNLVAANFPSTVVSSIFTVGRGIEIAPPKGGHSQ